MFRQPVWLSILLLTSTGALADEDSVAKTVLGPSNIYIDDGARELLSGNAEDGVELTLKGLNTAANHREEKVAHANLCAGFLLVEQYETALQHCDWVIEQDPGHWRTYNNRAIVYLRLERFEEAEADIRKGQQINPKSENLKEVKGMYLDTVQPVKERITIDDRRDGKTPKLDGDG